jgi:disulfide bond formation protein DsbB
VVRDGAPRAGPGCGGGDRTRPVIFPTRPGDPLFDLPTMKLFFAMLAVVTNVVVVGYVLSRIAGRWWPAAADLRARLQAALAGHELTLAALVAGTATLGSLYLSEIAHLTPCRMCWLQRLVMYPAALVLAVAAWRRYVRVRLPVMVGVAIGAALSTYHYLIQWFPSLESSGTCSVTVPCTTAWFRVFGFVSIPYMALSGFTFVFLMMGVLRAHRTEDT